MRKYFILSTICILFMTSGCVQNSKVNSPTSKTYAIGDTGPSGAGIVFYVTDGGLHGLEASPSGWNGGADDPESVWITGASNQVTLNGNTSTAIGTGLENSYAIRIQAGLGGNSAATICRNYTGGGKTDWFLPSKDELAELYKQNVNAGIFSAHAYWSSSEETLISAYGQSFSSGNQGVKEKSASYYVRAVRAF
jgi:hypothetical protein